METLICIKKLALSDSINLTLNLQVKNKSNMKNKC